MLVVPVLLVLVLPQRRAVPLGRGLRTARADVRDGLLARRIWPRVLLASVVAVLGHVLTFLVAAHAAGSHAPLSRAGPARAADARGDDRAAERRRVRATGGVAAWAFAAAGLTAAQGVTTAVLYGALVLVASLPGAAVLLVRRLRPRRSSPPAAGAPAGGGAVLPQPRPGEGVRVG